MNVFHIFRVESYPDTRLIYYNNHSQIVKETAEEVQAKVIACYQQIFSGKVQTTSALTTEE